jgi:hypothetical protein
MMAMPIAELRLAYGSPDTLDAVTIEDRIAADDRNIQLQRLAGEKTIKWIAMMEGKPA